MPSLMLNGRNYSGGGGGGGSSIQVDTMPTPTSSDLNKIVQYVGTTTSSYTNGYFYKCIFDDPNYVWEEIQVSEGGISTPIGATVTPTDVVQTWLACAELHQSYTTLSDVLADNTILAILMANTNAVDYLVRSTTWASTICADEGAMAVIGNNNYCSNILLADSTWKNALINSAYADEVFTIVPATTSASTEVGASSYHSDVYPPWKAFDQNLPSGTNFTGWAPSGTSGKIWYRFPKKIKAIKFSIYFISRGATGKYITGKFIGSNDGTNWTDISDSISVECDNIWHYFDSISNTEYEYIGFDVATIEGTATYGIKLQFYGRADVITEGSLGSLTDVNISFPSADQVISYNVSTQKWVNTTLEDGKIYKYTFSSVSSLPTTVNFTNGNGDLEVTHSYITNPSAITGDLTITTAARVGGGCSVTLSGTISGTTDISIQFVKPISLTVAS